MSWSGTTPMRKTERLGRTTKRGGAAKTQVCLTSESSMTTSASSRRSPLTIRASINRTLKTLRKTGAKAASAGRYWHLAAPRGTRTDH